MLLLAVGCGAPKAPVPIPQPPPPQEEPTKDTVHASGIEIMRRSTDSSDPMWSAKARWATLHYGEAGAFGGRLREVSGELFQATKPVSEFSAELATADKASGKLTLEGKVTVHGKEEKATLTCEKLTYLASTKRIEASGNVTIETPTYRAGPFPQAFARADLTLFATPDLFEDSK